MNVLQQLLTLAGVAMGALAAFATAVATERSRWKREQSVRWDDRRMAAYADYGDAVKKLVHLSYRVLVAQGLPANVDPFPGEEGLQQLAAAELERAARWEAVLLLGSADTITAGRNWHHEAWTLQWMVRSNSQDVELFKQTYVRADNARFGFYEAARADLGVRGSLPEVKWSEHGPLNPLDRSIL